MYFQYSVFMCFDWNLVYIKLWNTSFALSHIENTVLLHLKNTCLIVMDT